MRAGRDAGGAAPGQFDADLFLGALCKSRLERQLARRYLQAGRWRGLFPLGRRCLALAGLRRRFCFWFGRLGSRRRPGRGLGPQQGLAHLFGRLKAFIRLRIYRLGNGLLDPSGHFVIELANWGKVKRFSRGIAQCQQVMEQRAQRIDVGRFTSLSSAVLFRRRIAFGAKLNRVLFFARLVKAGDAKVN